MKGARIKIWAVLALVCILFLALVLITLRRPSRAGEAWLQVSAPVLGVTTNADGLHPFMALSISNSGPYALELQLRWFECRLKSDLANEPALRSSLTGRPVLPSGASNRLTWDFGPSKSPQDCLCCWAFDWQQHPSWRRQAATRWVDPALAWIQNCFQPGWKSYTWSLADWLEPLTEGQVFRSNVGVDDYFHLVYGLDRVKSSQTVAESSPLLATNTPGSPASTGLKHLAPSLMAQRAFNSYCVAMTLQPAASPAKPAP